MSIGRILAMKGVEVFTTTPEQSLQDVAAELVDRGVGALVVLDSSDEVVGLIGEREHRRGGRAAWTFSLA